MTGHRPYQEIAKFALDRLVRPHGNADCERIYNKVNLTKTKTRNKLATQSIDAILLSCDAVKVNSKNLDCTDFIPTDDMLRRLNSKKEINIEELADIEVNVN